MFSRLRIVLATAALGAAALIGVAACDPGTTSAVNAMSPEATALTALGFPAEDLAPAADPSATGAPGAKATGPRVRALRRALRGNVEHGEVVVKTKNGDQTIDIQRGTVTAVDSTSVTVKSADGYALTWTFGNPIRVVAHRAKAQPSAVTMGAEIGIAGIKTGSSVTARLIVIP